MQSVLNESEVYARQECNYCLIWYHRFLNYKVCFFHTCSCSFNSLSFFLEAVLLSRVPGNFISGNKRKWDVSQLTDFLKWLVSSKSYDYLSKSEGVCGKMPYFVIDSWSHVKFSFFVKGNKIKLLGESCGLLDVTYM